MKILSIDITNTKKLECFSLNCEGGNIEVAGTTGEGKTTAISALWDIIKSHPDSLKHGTKKGEMKVKVGEGGNYIIATRKQTTKTNTITLKDQDGNNFSIKAFKEMLSSLSINPHKIMDMKPKEQVATLLKAANLEDFNTEEVDSEISSLEEDRLELHRKCEFSKVGDEPDKVEQTSTAELVDKLNKSLAKNSKINEHKANLVSLKDDLEVLEMDLGGIYGEIEEFEKLIIKSKEEAKELVKQKVELSSRIEKGDAFCAKLELDDIEGITTSISEVESNNEAANKWAAWKEKKENYDKYKDRHTKVCDKIKSLRDSKQEALDNASWPLEGLSLLDGDVIYKDCLLSNLGESEQMLVCAALAVEDIKNHPLKVVRMDGVESMSKKDFTKLQELFNDNGIQVLSTRVSRGEVEENEIVIVDGVYTDNK
tara:strand:- start:29 stop:1306 length:1278 start_codon:yes stop_codon:yes gene_type:complete